MNPSTRRTVLAIAALGAALATARSARGQIIVAGPTTTEFSAAAGEQVRIPIAIDMTRAPGINLGSYRLRLSWNPAAFSFVNVTGGTFSPPVFNADSAAQGRLKFAAASAAGANGIFTLADVTLQVVATLSDTFRVAFDELTASGTFQDLLPYVSVTSGSFCGSDVWGDVNGNGQVQSVDAQIVLMHSVGLAVADTGRGDVDANSRVDPRDALVILSYVVGLDVSSFLVGKPVSAVCAQGAADTVIVLPTPLALAAGDQFQLTAQVRDTAGLLVGGRALAWASSDPAVANVDSTGRVTAVALGSATISAAAAPGVVGTVTVTVGERHRWVVNPLGAQGQQDEVGSEIHPFSTIAAAIERAAPGDTVFLAVFDYGEPLTTTKRLVFLGDSTAAGVPTISNPAAAASSINVTGRQVIRRLRFAQSAAGLDIQADTLELTSLAFEAIRGPAISAGVSGPVQIDRITVSGAVHAGMEIGSGGAVAIQRVQVAGVDADPVWGAAGIWVQADTVRLDSVAVRGVQGDGIRTQSAAHTRIRRSRVTDTHSGIVAASGVTLDVSDSVLVERVAYGGGIGGNVDTLRASFTAVRDVAGAAFFITSDAYDLALLSDVVMERVGSGLTGVGGRRAALVRSRLTSSTVTGIAPYADTIVIDRSVIEETAGHAVLADGAEYLRVVGSQLRRLAGAGIRQINYGVGYLEMTGSSIRGVRGLAAGDGGTGGVWAQVDSVLILDDTLTGIAQYYGVGHYDGSWLRVRRSVMSGVAASAVYAYGVSNVEVVGVAIDSAEHGLAAVTASTVRVDSSRIRYSYLSAVYANGVGSVQILADTLTNNFLQTGRPWGSGGYYYGTVSLLYVSSALARHNAFLDNWGSAVGAEFYYGQEGQLLFDSNVVRGGWDGVYVYGSDTLRGSVEVRGNSFKGVPSEYSTYQVYGYRMRALVVEDNTLDSIVGYGVYGYSVDTARIERNLIVARPSDAGFVGVTVYGGNAHTARQNDISCTGAQSGQGLAWDYVGGGLVDGNTVRDCRYGFESYGYGTGAGRTLTLSGNRLLNSTTGRDLYYGILAQPGAGSLVDIVGNRVEGGLYTGAALYVQGYGGQPLQRVRVVGDTITGGAGFGMRFFYVDTLEIDRSAVTGMARPAGYSGEFAAVQLRYINAVTRLTRNAITGNAYSGLLADAVIRGVLIDTNLVTDNLDTGMVFRWIDEAATDDTVRGTLNTVRRNRVGISTYMNDLLMPANNVNGNGVGLFVNAADTVDMAGSWWGDPLGPRCEEVWGCNPASTGDSLIHWSGRLVWQPPASAPVAGAPAGAPALEPAPIAVTPVAPVGGDARRTARTIPDPPAPRAPQVIEVPQDGALRVAPARPPAPDERVGRVRVGRDGSLIVEGGASVPSGPTEVRR